MAASVSSCYAAERNYQLDPAYSYQRFSIPQAEWEHAIAEGTMWKYVGDYNIYRCPDGDKGVCNIFNVSVDEYLSRCSAGTGAVDNHKYKSDTKPAERLVFLDVGYSSRAHSMLDIAAAMFGRWYDLPPMRTQPGNDICFRRWSCHIQEMD